MNRRFPRAHVPLPSTVRRRPPARAARGRLRLAAAKDASSPSSSSTASSALDAVSVAAGTKGVPTVTLKTKPFTVKETTHKVLTAGNGPAVKATDVVSADYLMLNGKDGKQLDTSYGKAPATMDLGGGRLLPGLTKSLVGGEGRQPRARGDDAGRRVRRPGQPADRRRCAPTRSWPCSTSSPPPRR